MARPRGRRCGQPGCGQPAGAFTAGKRALMVPKAEGSGQRGGMGARWAG